MDSVPVDNITKSVIMQNLLDGLQAQFTDSMTALHIKLASVSSALYFTLLKQWKRYVVSIHNVPTLYPYLNRF